MTSAAHHPSGTGPHHLMLGTDPARWLVLSLPAGLERFFADAGEPLPEPALPAESQAPTAIAYWRLSPPTACSHSRPGIRPVHQRTQEAHITLR